MVEDGNSAAASPRRILVVEDESAVRFNLASYLEDSGYEVETAAEGREALTSVAQGVPDLVLCDLWMPGMNGQELVSRLHTEYPDLPLIVVSGTGVLGDAMEALRRGAWDFVAKPIADMAVLEHAVNEALDKARLIAENHHYQRRLEVVNAEMREYLAQLEEDAEAGRSIQQQLMPQSAFRLGRYRFSRALVPSLHLSGDFVDYFALDDRHLAFYLADVSGHGVSSALVTVMLWSYIRQRRDALLQERDDLLLRPAATLEDLNSYLRGQRLDKYLTIFLGVLDVVDGQLAYANGGHYPEPLLVRGGEAHFVAGRGLPLGLMDASAYAPQTLQLEPGDALVACSDGVLELLPDQHLADKRQRLAQSVAHTPPKAEALLQALDIDPARRHPDDVTLLTLSLETSQ